jgi:hypothetical protein
MRRLGGALGALALLLLANAAWADRTPMVRSQGQKVSPAGPSDIRVPYLTTGNTAFGAYRVSPRIFASPVVDDLGNPGARPTYNLPFYGARMGFSGSTNGAVEKPYLLPSQAR